MITDRRKFTTKITHYGILLAFIFTLESIQTHSPGPYTPYKKPQQTQRPTRVDKTADDADIIQSQTANHHRLLSRMQEVNRLCTNSRAL